VKVIGGFGEDYSMRIESWMLTESQLSISSVDEGSSILGKKREIKKSGTGKMAVHRKVERQKSRRAM